MTTRVFRTVVHPDDTIHYWNHNYTHYEEIEMPTNKPNDQNMLAVIAASDLQVLKEKGETYGDSWKKRGGCDSWFMLCRKWDRLENMLQAPGPDQSNILVRTTRQFTGCQPILHDDTILAQIQDLRRYLLLVEGEVTQRIQGSPSTPDSWTTSAPPATAMSIGEAAKASYDKQEALRTSQQEALLAQKRKTPHPKAVDLEAAQDAEEAYKRQATDAMANDKYPPIFDSLAKQDYQPTDI